jgi:hypothetical protein
MYQGTNMRSFKEYLSESKKTWDFKVKIAGEVSEANESLLQSLLSKYQVSSFKKAGKTPIQAVPLDFPKITHAEVNIYEVTLDYPTTQWELHEYISNNLRISKDQIVVRNPNEPLEQYQQPTEAREGALLNDSEYKEAENADSKQYYGTEYNMSFVKALNDTVKAQREAQGQKIPTEKAATYTTDSAENTTSPIKQADYNPRK